jgi:hypothetical protein
LSVVWNESTNLTEDSAIPINNQIIAFSCASDVSASSSPSNLGRIVGVGKKVALVIAVVAGASEEAMCGNSIVCMPVRPKDKVVIALR